ncbi:MAG: DUF6641 family protein [Hyphomicrobiales bacterium]
MAHLSKLAFKTVQRAGPQRDPVMERREKLAAAIDEQMLVHAARLNGEDYTVERSKWQTDEQGERVEVKSQRRINPWFFEQDGAWFVQCRYGARLVLINGTDNAVSVRKLEDVLAVLKTFKAAVEAGELDGAVAKATERKTAKNPSKAA